MPQYRVKEPGFFGGIFRTPGGKHDPVVTANPLKPVPAWLEEIKEERRTKKETVPNEKPADFMGGKQEDDKSGLETL